MSWPRKDDGYRLYKERNGYLLVSADPAEDFAVGDVYDYGPSLCGCSYPTGDYFYKRCKRVAWSDLPQEYQDAFRRYMRPMDEGDPEWIPESIRGLWRIGEQPTVIA